jgi:PIN domain nuclease of toxin-antitoxin system
LTVAGVADTHTVLWYLFGDARLSAAAKAFIDDAASNGSKVAVSSISLVEVVYLVEKGRVLSTAYIDMVGALKETGRVFEEAPVSLAVVEAMRQVSREEVPDMPDRIVAATGIYFGVPVISRDRRIRAASLKTIW